MEERKRTQKGDRKGQPISNRENTENLFPLLLRSDLSAKVDLYGLFEFADKDDICEGKDSVVKEIVESINEMTFPKFSRQFFDYFPKLVDTLPNFVDTFLKK